MSQLNIDLGPTYWHLYELQVEAMMQAKWGKLHLARDTMQSIRDEAFWLKAEAINAGKSNRSG